MTAVGVGITFQRIYEFDSLPVEFFLFIPSGADAFITSGGDTFKVRG